MERIARVRFNIIREIGLDAHGNRRGRAAVYLAHEPNLGGEVAVKEINKKDFRDPGEYFQEAHRMFEVHSEHVVPVQYMCERGDKINLVMRYFRQKSLADRIEHGPLGLSESMNIALGILRGLAQIHPKTFHFDIKPSNILFSDNKAPMVADFGQSRTVRSDGTVEMPDMYDLALPPEWFSSGVGTVHSDIYQMGLTLYRMVNGDPFFYQQVPNTQDELALKIQAGKFPSRTEFLPHVPKRLQTVIRKALSVDPTSRFHSAHEFQNALSFPLKHDWRPTVSHNGVIEWESVPNGRAKLVVGMKRQGSGWRVDVHKVGAKRTRHRPSDWNGGPLTLPQAFSHLRTLFRDL